MMLLFKLKASMIVIGILYQSVYKSFDIIGIISNL